MATWKKVIVSGSTANLAALQVDNLTSGQVVIGGGTSNLSTTAINGTGNIVATTNATGLVHSGSFSGSFQGNFVGTTDLPDLTQGTGITAFTYDGATTATVAVSGASALSVNNVTKWTGAAFANSSLTDNGTAITGATSIQLTGANSNLSGSFSGSFQGNGSGLTGVTATFPVTAKTDLATTDQFFISDGTSKFVTYGNLVTDLAGAGAGTSNLTTGDAGDSLALTTIISGLSSVTSTNFTGSLLGTASWANNAISSSYAASVNNITNAITNNTDNYVLTATGGGTINGEGNLQFDGTTLTITGNEVVTGNLTVQGTASFQHTTNLDVADRFILLASGSNTTGDGGIVIQQGTQGIGETFAYDASTTRWAVTGSFNASQATFVPEAFMATVIEGAASDPTVTIAKLTKKGNIFVAADESIYIYS
jgi:hypothetical protein